MKDKKRLQIIIAAVACSIVLIIAGIICVVLHEKKNNSKVAEDTNSATVSETGTTESESESENNQIDKPVDVEETETEDTSTAEPVIDDTYYITVNRIQNIVIIYKIDDTGNYQPIKAMICSVGVKEGVNNETPLGEYRTANQWRWAALNGSVYGQYVTRFKGPYLFHSVPYYDAKVDKLETEEYNKLGSPASQGCVRLKVEDAKWIYDNIPEGTKVVVYDSEEPEPLERPTSVQLDVNSPYAGWDPTDPDPKNPWPTTGPVFEATEKEIKVEAGTDYDVSKITTARNYRGDSVEVKVSGSVNTYAPASYTITCEATDSNGNTSSTTYTVVVEDTTKPTVSLVNSSLSVPFEKCVDQATLTEFIKTNIVAEDTCSPKDDITITLTTSDVSTIYNKAKKNQDVSGTVHYTVKDKAGNEVKGSMTVVYSSSETTINSTESISINEDWSGKEESEIQAAIIEMIKESITTAPLDYKSSCTVTIANDSNWVDFVAAIKGGTLSGTTEYTINYSVTISNPSVNKSVALLVVYTLP